MTKNLAIIIGLLCFLTAKGQDTKKITIDDKFFRTKEAFYVLKDNPEIRHGEYKRTSGKLKTIGQYENNKRIGIWESFGENGRLIQTIDFSNNTVTTKTINVIFDLESLKCWVKQNDVFVEVKPEQAPAFIGGYNTLYNFIGSTLRYPADARRNGTQGKVIISVVITKDGEIIDETVEKGLGHGLDEEALRVIKLIPDEWVAGKVNGQQADIKILIPITFRLG